MRGAQFCDEGPRSDLVVVVVGPWSVATAREILERAGEQAFSPRLLLSPRRAAQPAFPAAELLLEREPEPEFGCCAALTAAPPAPGRRSPLEGGSRLGRSSSLSGGEEVGGRGGYR